MLRVMAVDDQEPIRHWIKFCIEKIDDAQMVGIASNGADGLALYDATSPDVIFTDIKMPVMNGLEMVREIYLKNPHVYIIVLTSYDEFEYAREAIKNGVNEYVLKTEVTESAINEVLDRANIHYDALLKTNSLGNYEKVIERNMALRSLIADVDLAVDTKALQDICVTMMGRSFIAISISAGIVERKAYLEKIVSSLGMKNHIDFPYDLDITVILGNIESGDWVNDCIKRVVGEDKVVVGVSSVYSAVGELGLALREAVYRNRQSFYDVDKRMFFKEDISVFKLPNRGTFKVDFSGAMSNKDYAMASELKRNMQAAVHELRPVDIVSLKRVYTFFISTILHMEASSEQQYQEKYTELVGLIEQAEELSVIDDLLDEVFFTYEEMANRRKNLSNSVRNAMEYISKNYDRQINLTEVAMEVSLSPEYFSRLFKEEMGIKFIVYVNGLRMKKAKNLLESTNLKVYEVAEAVGYSNLSYFSTLFKKHFGVNPYEYKSKS